MSTQQPQSSSKVILIVIVAVLAVIAIGGIIYASTTGSSKTVAVAAVPAHTSSTGVISVGNGPVQVDVYEDFQCPSCAKTEAVLGADLTRLVETNAVTLNYHMMSFLGPESERAAAAGFCAANDNKFEQFHSYLFAHQPQEHSGGYTTSDLIAAGKAVGLGQPFADCVTAGTYAALTKTVDDSALQAGVTGTPTFFVDGTKLTPKTVDDVLAAILAATKNATPSPSVSASK